MSKPRLQGCSQAHTNSTLRSKSTAHSLKNIRNTQSQSHICRLDIYCTFVLAERSHAYKFHTHLMRCMFRNWKDTTRSRAVSRVRVQCMIRLDTFHTCHLQATSLTCILNTERTLDNLCILADNPHRLPLQNHKISFYCMLCTCLHLTRTLSHTSYIGRGQCILNILLDTASTNHRSRIRFHPHKLS